MRAVTQFFPANADSTAKAINFATNYNNEEVKELDLLDRVILGSLYQLEINPWVKNEEGFCPLRYENFSSYFFYCSTYPTLYSHLEKLEKLDYITTSIIREPKTSKLFKLTDKAYSFFDNVRFIPVLTNNVNGVATYSIQERVFLSCLYIMETQMLLELDAEGFKRINMALFPRVFVDLTLPTIKKYINILNEDRLILLKRQNNSFYFKLTDKAIALFKNNI